MAIAFLSTSYKDRISAVLEGFQDMQRIQLAGAHQLDYSHIG